MTFQYRTLQTRPMTFQYITLQTRPMTFQYITLKMVEVARINGGFIDQTKFKTAATYTFDTLIISGEVIKVLYCYMFHVRPLLTRLTLTIWKDKKHSSDVAKRFTVSIYQEILPQGRCASKKWLEIIEHVRKSSFLICCPRSIAIIWCSINR